MQELTRGPQLAVWLQTHASHLLRSSALLEMRLLVLYDPDPTISPSSIPANTPLVHSANLFDVVPELALYMAKHSPLERWYAQRGGFVEPAGSEMLIVSKLLIRKVAAIHYALSRALAGGDPTFDGRSTRMILWADADIEFRHPLDAAFFRFALLHDVSYVPARPGGKSFEGMFAAHLKAHLATHSETQANMSAGGSDSFSRRIFSDAGWYLESGVMTFAVNERSLAFVSAAVELYEGGLLHVAHHCGCARYTPDRKGSPMPCSGGCPPFVARNLFSNDIFVWSMVAHIASSSSSSSSSRRLIPNAACCLEQGGTAATMGWLPFHTSTLMRGATAFTAPWSLDHYAHHHTVRDGPLTARIFTADAHRMQASKNRTKLRYKSDERLRVYTRDSRLLTTSVDLRYWANVAWNDAAQGIPLRPRIARCGCQYSIASSNVIGSPHACSSHASLERAADRFGSNGTVLIIGANEGANANDPAFSLLASPRAASLTKIFVEPIPYLYRRLQHNLGSMTNAFAFNFAVGQEAGCARVAAVPPLVAASARA